MMVLWLGCTLQCKGRVPAILLYVFYRVVSLCCLQQPACQFVFVAAFMRLASSGHYSEWKFCCTAVDIMAMQPTDCVHAVYLSTIDASMQHVRLCHGQSYIYVMYCICLHASPLSSHH